MDALADDWIVDRLEVAYYVGMMEHLLERDHDAGRHLERTLAAAQETGKTFVLAPAGAALAQAKLRRGRVVEAAETASDAVDAARLTGNPQSVAQALAAQARALLVAGELREALAAAQESVRLAGELEPSALATASALALGAALLEAGRPAEAAAAVRTTARLPLVPGTTGCEAHELLVRAALAGGSREEAERLAGRAEARAGRVDLPVTWAQAGRARALVSLDAGDAAGAAHAALAAAASAATVGAVLEEARAQLLAGVATAAAGDRDGAVAELTTARETFETCGAKRLADECAQELRRLGERVPRRSARLDAGEGVAGVDQPRARDRPARARRQDEPRDRRRAVPQREDRRDAPAQHLRQARRGVAQGRRRGGRARRAGLSVPEGAVMGAH